jgi:quinol monooxygenase YgiN
MILVTGTILARPETVDELKRLSLEHTQRSRAEPGCISHDVHVDCENPLRIAFTERWADAAALKAHFLVPASGAFVQQAAKLAAGGTTDLIVIIFALAVMGFGIWIAP